MVGRTIALSTAIHAPIDRVFDLSRSIDLHMESTKLTGEKVVAGVASGLIGLGESVTWRARHFGIWQQLTSRITAFDRPHHFQDCMVKGAFAFLKHDHRFRFSDGVTIMEDEFQFASPLAPLGYLVDALILKRYLTNLLVERNAVIKSVAESDGWTRYVVS